MSVHVKTSFAQQQQQQHGGDKPDGARSASKVRRTVVTRVYEAVKAVALCHNVTPVYEVSDVT